MYNILHITYYIILIHNYISYISDSYFLVELAGNDLSKDFVVKLKKKMLEIKKRKIFLNLL